MKGCQIIPAVIAQTQGELNISLKKINNLTEKVQLDIMNNSFVPNHSLDFDFSLFGFNNLSFEAHLMIDDPFKWIKENWDKASIFLPHIETCDNPLEIIKFVKNKKKKIGLAVNPDTSLKDIADYLYEIDQLLIMTVYPGFYGNSFLQNTIKKIWEARRLNPDLDIEVDGGITPETIKLAYNAGANIFVSGSFIMKAQNSEVSIEMLKSQIA